MMVIKDALLSLLKKKDYSQITVTDICHEAEISRGTFYAHFDNISQVVDALYDDVQDQTHSVLRQINCVTARNEPAGYPLCLFLRENKKYQPLFFSDSLHTYVMDRITEDSFESFARRMGASGTHSREELYAVFYFQISGCLAACKKNKDVSDEKWKELQGSIDRVLKEGITRW